MRILTLAFLLVRLQLQAQFTPDQGFRPYFIDQDRFVHDSAGYKGKLVLDTMYYPDKSISAIGTRAVDKFGQKSLYKVGAWTEFFENGKVKSSGYFALQTLYACESSMPAIKYYSHKTGDWTYYYDNGKLAAIGTYTIERREINTGIADQYVNIPVAKDGWRFYDLAGRQIDSLDRADFRVTTPEF